MDRFAPWLETMFLFCSSEAYDLERFKTYLSEDSGEHAWVQRQFQEVLYERHFSASDWSMHMNFAHKSDEDLYDYLTALYEFLFNDGLYPEWD